MFLSQQFERGIAWAGAPVFAGTAFVDSLIGTVGLNGVDLEARLCDLQRPAGERG